MSDQARGVTRRTLLWTGLSAAGIGVALAVRQAPGSSRAQEWVEPVQYGPNVSLGGWRPFPEDNPWNLDVSRAPVDPASTALLTSIGLDTGLHADFGTTWQDAPNGIPYVVVPPDQPMVPASFEYAEESDPGPYPIPADAPVEGGSDGSGDRHVLVVDRENQRLYELFAAFPESGGVNWRAGSGAVFDLTSNALRPEYWTSADAAGLPIFPGLVRYDEAVEQGVIAHALRFTARRPRRAFVPPARATMPAAIVTKSCRPWACG